MSIVAETGCKYLLMLRFRKKVYVGVLQGLNRTVLKIKSDSRIRWERGSKTSPGIAQSWHQKRFSVFEIHAMRPLSNSGSLNMLKFLKTTAFITV